MDFDRGVFDEPAFLGESLCSSESLFSLSSVHASPSMSAVANLITTLKELVSPKFFW